MGTPEFLANLDRNSDSLGTYEARAVLLAILPFNLGNLMLTPGSECWDWIEL